MGGKALLYDLASKIPCFIYDPTLDVCKRGRVVSELISSLDIPKTILDYAGVQSTNFMTGSSLRPLLEGNAENWRKELFLESLYTGRDTPFQEGMRMGKWKYIRMFDAPGKYNESHVDFTDKDPAFEMLFDLDADPGEINNLAKSKPNHPILQKLRAKTIAGSTKLNKERKRFKKAYQVQSR